MMWEIIPNPGRIRIYTSGCPKNQNKCWYRIGSPPPAGSKKEVFKFRSVNNIVMAPASTGNDSNNKMAVIITAHTNRGICSDFMLDGFILIAVEIKFTAPKIDDTPARCKEKIVKSTDAPAWAIPLANGGYTVHPVPAPLSTILLVRRSVSEGGSSQNLMLFIRGNAISGAPSISGTNQFPKPPIKIGITMKKIMMNACAVTITL
jgi:hypothetical protein